MQRGWYWTTGSGAFQRFPSRNLIQPSSLCCLLPSQAMELCSEPEWLLLQILCWKARPLARCGQSIEFWVSTERCVCAGGLVCSRRGDFRCLSRRRRHARPAAVAALQPLDAHSTQSDLRIGCCWGTDAAKLVSDNGKQCFSALPSLNPHPALLALLLASIAGDGAVL